MKILVNTRNSQVVYDTKKEAQEALGVGGNRINRLIETGQPIVIDKKDHYVDELVEDYRGV